MPTSDEDLQAKSEEVQKLRDQVANSERNRIQRESELSNEIAMKQLEAEEHALRARLAVTKEAGKVASVKAGADAPLQSVKEQMERAVAQEKAAEKAAEDAKRATEGTSTGGASGDTAATSGDASNKEGQ